VTAKNALLCEHAVVQAGATLQARASIVYYLGANVSASVVRGPAVVAVCCAFGVR
jgi:hypothetical protein